MCFKTLRLTGLGLALVSLATLCGCADYLSRVGSTEYVYSLDGVKWIAVAKSDPRDESTFGQRQYTLSDSERLLVRFESLSAMESKVDISTAEKRVLLELYVAEDRGGTVELCPLTKTWMMLATWQRAHPFGADGAWNMAGGDFEESACERATVVRREGAPDLLQFDITDWFVNYVRGRGVNYGHVVRAATGSLALYGEASGSYSPRTQFSRY